jgi:hypothetical protein
VQPLHFDIGLQFARVHWSYLAQLPQQAAAATRDIAFWQCVSLDVGNAGMPPMLGLALLVVIAP